MVYTALEAQRLDEFVKTCVDVTRSCAQRLIEQGCVHVDGELPRKAGQQLRAGQQVDIVVPEPVAMNAVAQDIPIDIIYQDDWLAVVNKPCGMVVHPAAGNPDGTLVNALLGKLDRLSGIGGELRPGILHRIDKDTTGLLLVAKSDAAHQSLSAQIAAHTVGRVYLALLAQLNGATLIEARLRTGRTHQIRVHMASLGHPVLGDPLYGPHKCPVAGLDHQLLHACRIAFDHPADGVRRVFAVEPPEEFMRYYCKLGGDPALIKDIVQKYRRDGQ